MTLNARSRRLQARLAARPGVRSVRRPITPDGAQHFDLHYVRTGPPSPHPVLVIPGGPGMASIHPYQALRKHAAALGLDVVMVEHRGVGMSRRDDAGRDLPAAAITVDQAVDDLGAVLDDIGADRAIVYGTSYGTYLAAGLGVRHRDRIHAMVLDSPLLSVGDIAAARQAIRGLLLGGDESGAEQLAAKMHRLVDSGTFDSLYGQVAATAYEYGGPPLLERLLELRLSGHPLLWGVLRQIATRSMRNIPYRNEVDLVNRIAFRELDYAGEPDGLPLDPAEALRAVAGPGPLPEFEGEPYDLVAEMPGFDWPTVVVSGQRDMTTPPAVAERIAALIPGAVLVKLRTAAHSALDTRESAALRIARSVVDGRAGDLPVHADELDALPGNPVVRLLVWLITLAAALERMVPGVKPIA